MAQKQNVRYNIIYTAQCTTNTPLSKSLLFPHPLVHCDKLFYINLHCSANQDHNGQEIKYS